MESVPVANIRRFLDSLKAQPGVLASALSFMELDNAARRRLIRELAKASEKKITIEKSQSFPPERDYIFQDGLLKAATIAVAMKMHAEAHAIAEVIPHERPRLWSFTDRFSNKDAFTFITCMALRAAVESQSITEYTLLPQELIDIGARVPGGAQGDAFQKALKAELEEQFKSQEKLPDEKKSMSYDTKREAERFIEERLGPLLEMTQVFTAMLSSGAGKGDKSFLGLVDVWTRFRVKQERYSSVHETNLFFDLLGRQLLTFAIWARNDIKASSAEAFAAKVSEAGFAPVSELVNIIAILAKKRSAQNGWYVVRSS